MTGTRSGNGPDDGEVGSWASETLPLAVRKQLLESELRKLGSRKAEAARAAMASAGEGAQQQAQSAHPQADDDSQHGGG